ncbi:sigma-70 family RNA polymerase sigma factor [Streptomyces sp. NPDC014864]|uniref:sigma-70 family RNA polymerase sigma factor n=1 Tax=Streptomyces sp. NPDC014864 TaxID=3364924 RepID=UPI0036FA335E
MPAETDGTSSEGQAPHGVVVVVAVVNAILGGVGGLYAATHSTVLTAAGGAFAVVLAGLCAYLHSARGESGTAIARRKDQDALTSSDEGAMPVEGQESYEAFFSEQYASLVGLLIRCGAPPCEADDAAAEAMSIVFEKWEVIGNPRAYASTTALRLIRRNSREVPVEAHQLDRELRSRLGDGMEARLVADLLPRLPPQQRVVVALFCDGYTPAEIAELLDKPVATVRSNLRHGRSSLRQWIDEEDLG